MKSTNSTETQHVIVQITRCETRKCIADQLGLINGECSKPGYKTNLYRAARSSKDSSTAPEQGYSVPYPRAPSRGAH